MVYVCAVCGYQYNDDEESAPFEELPEDWSCPVCDEPKGAFQDPSGGGG